MSKNIEVSIVTPMHNEKECINEFYNRVTKALKFLKTTYEIVLVNDGSTDNTGDIIRSICSKDENVIGVFLSRNRGQCTAIYAGIQHSHGKYIVIMDGDLQHLPEEIPDLIYEIRKGYDFVSGSRRKRSESLLLRRIPSKIANFILRSITKCPVRDMGGFSCMKGEIARKLTLRAGQHRLLPALIFMMGGSVSEVPVSAPKRFAGKSHYGIARSVDVLFDIIMLWFQNSFKQRPLYLFGRISLFFFLISMGLLIWVFIEKVFFKISMGTRPPFLIGIFLMLFSFGFIAIGFILEILVNILDSVNDTKPYVVKEITKKQAKSKKK